MCSKGNRVLIDSRAIIDPSAQIADNVTIGPWTIIGPDVVIGEGTEISSHVVVKGPTTIGKNNRIFQFCTIGEDCQDKKYAGEPTRLVIGNNNVFRECVTVHRGTIQDNGVTVIGDNNLLMAYTHVAHDCLIGSHNIFANCATIAGHVVIGDYVILGGMTGVHQFSKIGKAAMVGAYTRLTKDVLPFLLCEGNPAVVRGLNSIGLRRSKVGRHVMKELKELYKLIFESNLNTKQAIDEVQKRSFSSVEAKELIAFLNKPSERGLVKRSESDL